ncbi:hypothetical protein HYW42_00885 [Candidatus Daviesbacteria bacterium]|nr:hypothetical protein [Candidatus Daviesbacteria bacterium]
MKIEKKYRFIDIQGSDFGKLTDIAYLVDNLYFLDKVEEIREKLGLTFEYPLSKTDEEKIDKMFEYKNKELNENLSKEAERIRKLFKMPPHFREVIQIAIIYGKINDFNYSKAYLEKQEITPTNDPNEVPDIKYCIVIHSGTGIEDIKKVFRKFQDEVRINFKASEEEKHRYNFGYWLEFGLTRPMDPKTSITDLRPLYHLRRNGMKPLEIALKDLRISKKQYKEALEGCRLNNKGRLDNKEKSKRYDECDALIVRVQQRRDSIKSLIKRYIDFLSAPNSLL